MDTRNLSNRLMVAAVAVLLVFSLCSCKDKGLSKEEYKSMYEGALDELLSTQEEVDNCKIKLKEYGETIDENDIMEIYHTLEDGTIGGFVSFDDKIALRGNLALENTEAIANTTNVQLSNGITFSPSNNWTVQCNTSKTVLNHVSGIYGEISLYYYYNPLLPDFMYDTYYNNYMVDNGFKNIQKKFIYSDESSVGVYTISDTVIYDTVAVTGADGVVTTEQTPINAKYYIGTIGANDKLICFEFVYKEDGSTAQAELIETILSTIKVDGIAVTLE